MTLRTERVSSVLKEEVGAFLIREFRDPTLGLITVTDVHMSADLKIAKIYVSIFGSPAVKEKTMKALEERKSEIRSFIGSHVRIKFTPSIALFLDETLDRVEHIERILKKIHTANDDGTEGPVEGPDASHR
jgi:ribosome-binding factor A